MYCIEESACDIVETFRRPPVIRRPGHCAVLAPLLRPWLHQNKNRTAGCILLVSQVVTTNLSPPTVNTNNV